MKLGILTYHRTQNYGGCLQALALRVVLEKLGHKVYYVDYWPQYHNNAYKTFNQALMHNLNLLQKISYIVNTLKYLPSMLKRSNAFDGFHKRYIIPYCRPMTECYDAVIYGSDQIWRKQVTGSYNPVYFGNNNVNTHVHIAFSASMGILPQSEIDKKLIKELVSGLANISVREFSLLQVIKGLGFENAVQTIDPTLLLTSEEWDQYISKTKRKKNNKKYLLLYLLRGGFDEDTVRQYAKKRGLGIKIIKGHARFKQSDDIYMCEGPIGFVDLIRDAEIVVTSSFHGLAFSLIYGKDVFVSFDENGDRGLSLLNDMGIPERYLQPNSELPVEYAPINYSIVYERINKMKKQSMDYLITSLKNVE